MQTIQMERISQLRISEKVSRRLAPNGWREILTLVKLLEEIEKHGSTSSRTLEEGHAAEQPPAATDITSSLKDLDHVDRQLLREAVKELKSNSSREAESKGEPSTHTCEERRNNDE